jgi:protein gp37
VTAAKTRIAWTDATWNPVTGCSKVSEGCRHCYAEAVAKRFWGDRKFTDVRCHEDRLEVPLRWRKARRVFVNSMSDLFHKDVPDAFIDRVFAVMALAPKHTFQILTKRPARMRSYCLGEGKLIDRAHEVIKQANEKMLAGEGVWPGWPLPNVWLGVSCEDQCAADERVPLLLQTPAEVRFLSCEPLLGPIDLRRYMWPVHAQWRGPQRTEDEAIAAGTVVRWNRQGLVLQGTPFVNWVIVGGESGRGFRPMDLDWARSLQLQCERAGTAFFFKQHSGPRPGMGEDALGEVVQQFPEPARAR